MDDLDESLKTRRKVFNVLVECLQNLYHHIDDFKIEGSPEEVAKLKSAVFMISRNKGYYNVVTGNFLLSENVPKLTDRITTINSFDRDELKEYYKSESQQDWKEGET